MAGRSTTFSPCSNSYRGSEHFVRELKQTCDHHTSNSLKLRTAVVGTGIALHDCMKIIVMQYGWVTYDLGATHETKARNLIANLYERLPEATIYIDRGAGWEFVNPHRILPPCGEQNTCDPG